jgi:small conductance mechanosensitive channel
MDSFSNTLQHMLTDFLDFLPNIIIALVIFILSLYVAGLLAKIVRTTMEKRKSDNEIKLLVEKLTRWSIIILGIFAALQQVGFNLTAFLTGVGILGFTIGFALQDVSKNFVAGLLLLLEQPFDIGDVIEVGDFTGTVADVELRATEIYTPDGQNVLIPNAEVFTNPIKNYSRYSNRRFDLTIGVAYESDLDLVRDTAVKVIHSIPGALSDPEPRVVFNNLGTSTIDFTLYYWVDLKVGNYFDSIDLAVTGIKTAFEENKIDMPYPIQTVLLEK